MSTDPDSRGSAIERFATAQLVRDARALAATRRADVARSASRTFPSVLNVPRSFSGEAFIESEGIVLPFEAGLETANVYNLQATEMRTVATQRLQAERQPFFNRVFASLTQRLRVLNVGCGNDLAIEEACRAATLEVIHTDASFAVTEKLAPAVDGRVFAADLVDLHRYIPAGAADVVFGNSVMGYASIDKLPDIIRQSAAAAAAGVIFTYDMGPHGDYFDAVNPVTTRTVVNDGYGDPAVLARMIDTFGTQQGPAAFLYHSAILAASVQLGLMLFTRDVLEGLGLTVRISRVTTPYLIWLLRAVKTRGDLAIMRGLDEEEEVADVVVFWHRVLDEPRTRPAFIQIDREQASRLCAKLGIKATPRAAPWDLIKFINQNDFPISEETKAAVDARSGPMVVKAAIASRSANHDYARPKRMAEAVEVDQSIRASYIRGELFADLDDSEAIPRIDAMIDARYAKQEGDQRRALADAAARRDKEKKREAAGRAKVSRRKNRR